MIRFINTSTAFPFDKELTKEFNQVFNKDYLKRLEPRNGQVGTQIDIFFVDEQEIDTERSYSKKDDEIDGEFDMDLIGLHVPCHSIYKKETILICPEKIMNRSLSLASAFTHSYSHKDIYKTLICGVIIHELAHWIMCEGSVWSTFPTWQKGNNNTTTSVVVNNKTKHPITSSQCGKVIEESLANAFIFINNFSTQGNVILEEFIKRQSPPYKAGLNWDATKNLIITSTMSKWCGFKHLLASPTIYKTITDQGPDFADAVNDNNKPLFNDLTEDLLNNNIVSTVPDFKADAEQWLGETGELCTEIFYKELCAKQGTVTGRKQFKTYIKSFPNLSKNDTLEDLVERNGEDKGIEEYFKYQDIFGS